MSLDQHSIHPIEAHQEKHTSANRVMHRARPAGAWQAECAASHGFPWSRGVLLLVYCPTGEEMFKWLAWRSCTRSKHQSQVARFSFLVS